MTKIAIVTDSNGSLPLEVSRQYGIFQVPTLVKFGQETFKTLYEINDADAFARIAQTGKIPTTSAPLPAQFSQAFQEAFERGYDEVLCFTMSSQLSVTHVAARNAAGQMPERKIQVVDTHSVTIQQGFMIMAAAENLAQGGDIPSAIQAAESLRSRSFFFLALSTLKYLSASGRIGYLTASLGNFLDIKPILALQDGKLEIIDRVRSLKSAWEHMISMVVDEAAAREIERAGIVHVNALQNAQEIEKQLRGFLPMPDEVLHFEYNPGLSVHIGEGAIGICLVTK